jgi:hypothetical protein
MRDQLLGPTMIAACALNFVVQGLLIGVQALAYFRYDADAKVLGYLFGAFGVGALCGAVAAQQLTRKADLLKLAAFAIVAMPLPLFLLTISLPWALSGVVIGAFGFFTPLVNAPLAGVLTVRTPEALRAKVITAVFSVATLSTFFLVLSALMTLGGLAFAAILLRNSSAPAVTSMPDVAPG